MEKEVFAMKRLYRVEEGRKLCGVCGGIAEYLNVDPSVIRVIWAVASIIWGAGVIAYLICAFVLPNKSEIHFDDDQK